MQILIATYGSRGDVQPLVALTLGLQARGHEVRLAGPPEWRVWAEKKGFTYRPLGSDLRPFLARVKASHDLRSGAAFHKHVMAEVVTQFERLPDMIARADLVVGASLCLALPSVAEAFNIPYRYIAFTPQMLPSGAHPCPVFRRQNLPVWINRLGWRLETLVQRFDLLPTVNRFRRRLGLPPLKAYWPHLLGKPLLLACDAALAPVPPDVRRPVVQTGYPHLSGTTDLAPDVEAFLAAGPPPFYAGFGSMPPGDAASWIPMVVDAARTVGQRLILRAEGSLMGRVPAGDDLYVGSAFDHQALLPRMRAVIHHGGAGTTAAAARSGVPQIIVPHILDQYFWGERIHRLGLGPKPIWRCRMTASRLQSAMARCLADKPMAHEARRVGQRIRSRTPISTAAHALENA